MSTKVSLMRFVERAVSSLSQQTSAILLHKCCREYRYIYLTYLALIIAFYRSLICVAVLSVSLSVTCWYENR